jgi:hypothetical protein
VLVLHNFNDGLGGSLSSKGININKLFDGMAPSAGQEKIARKQLYFFDTCRITPDAFKEHEVMGVGDFWDAPAVPAVDDRVQPSFFAAKPGGTAFAIPGKATLFGGALLKCLQGGAGVPINDAEPDDSEWIISLESLRGGLRKHIEAANVEEAADQVTLTQNIDSDFVLLRLETPPPVAVRLTIDPSDAANLAKVNLLDRYDTPVGPPVVFDPDLFETQRPGGSLIVSAVVDPESPALVPKYRQLLMLKPPSVSVVVRLSRKA